MSPDPTAIDDYIQQNKARYTREAIREQLVAAGHDPAAVDEAWERIGASSGATKPVGWRPGWREFWLLLVVGAIGAGIVWAGEPYGAGGIAPFVYAIVFAIGFGAAKLISVTIDGGNIGRAALLLAVAGVASLLLAAINQLNPILLAVGGALAIVAVGLLAMRGRNPAGAGMIGAALPIVVWLLITGTCYTPLLSRG